MYKDSMRRDRSRRGGKHFRRYAFTLIEVLLACVLSTLMAICAFSLYIFTTQESVKCMALSDASNRSANLIQNVTGQIREANSVALPGEPAFTPDSSFTAANTTTSFMGQTINTAIYLILPGSGSFTTFYDGGTAQIPIGPYNNTVQGPTQVLIYRGDIDGAPDPASGMYVCQTTGAPQSATVIGPLSDTSNVASAAPNAVQFIRMGIDQVEIRLIDSNYSSIGGSQSSETFSPQVTAKYVYLRDHD